MEKLNSIEMGENNKTMDLVYFGYPYENDSKELERKFMEEIGSIFPECILNDAYDEFKGYRRVVIIPLELKDDYYTWIFESGWVRFSLNATLMKMSGIDEFKKYI
jgi:hypothetical protein